MKPDPRRFAHRILVDYCRGKVARLGEALEESKLRDPRDRGLARELALGVVRRRRLLDFALIRFLPRGLPVDPSLRTALEIGAYQLLIRRTPAHAAVNESVRLVHARGRGVVNAVLRRVAETVPPEGADLGSLEGMPDDPAERLAIVHGLPDFLVAGWVERFGLEQATQACVASSAQPALHLRQTARLSPGGSLCDWLASDGVTVVAASDDARPERDGLWRVEPGGESPFITRAFRDGAFVVQDPTAVAAARALAVESGDQVLDLCAAPGTKTTLLAEAAGEGGLVWAHDPDERRRPMIEANVERLRLNNVKIVGRLTELDGLRVPRVLVDVPCSNSGVLGRRVEARDRITADAVAALATTQRAILEAALEHCAPDATVVYSTCSIEEIENERVVDCVRDREGWTVEEERTTLPEAGRCDGGFFARMRRGEPREAPIEEQAPSGSQ